MRECGRTAAALEETGPMNCPVGPHPVERGGQRDLGLRACVCAESNAVSRPANQQPCSYTTS